MFGDLDWPPNASRRFVSISWASCYWDSVIWARGNFELARLRDSHRYTTLSRAMSTSSAPYRIVLLSPERSNNQDHALFRTSENSSTGCCFSYVWKIRQLRCYNPLSMSPSPRQLSWQWCVPEFEKKSVGPCDVDIWPFLFQNWDSVTCAKWRISTEVDVSKTFRTRLILSPEWDRYFFIVQCVSAL